MPEKGRLFSGIRLTGPAHLGDTLGAIKDYASLTTVEGTKCAHYFNE